MFNDVEIRIDSAMRPNAIDVCGGTEKRYRFILTSLDRDRMTDDEHAAREVANRLLDRDGPALTLEMLQTAIDAASHWHQPITHISMTASLRREYLALLEPDRRYTHNPFHSKP